MITASAQHEVLNIVPILAHVEDDQSAPTHRPDNYLQWLKDNNAMVAEVDAESVTDTSSCPKALSATPRYAVTFARIPIMTSKHRALTSNELFSLARHRDHRYTDVTLAGDHKRRMLCCDCELLFIAGPGTLAGTPPISSLAFLREQSETENPPSVHTGSSDKI